MKQRIVLHLILMFCCLNAVAQETEQLHPQLSEKFEVTKVDRTIKGLFARWAKQDGKKLDWKFKYSDVSLLEVSLGSKRPEEYAYLLRGSKNIKDAIDVLLSQQLALNVGQTIEEIYEPNTIKACISDKTITILNAKQRCPSIDTNEEN